MILAHNSCNNQDSASACTCTDANDPLPMALSRSRKRNRTCIQSSVHTETTKAKMSFSTDQSRRFLVKFSKQSGVGFCTVGSCTDANNPRPQSRLDQGTNTHLASICQYILRQSQRKCASIPIREDNSSSRSRNNQNSMSVLYQRRLILPQICKALDRVQLVGEMIKSNKR